MKGLRPLNLTRKAMKMSPKRPITKLIVTLSMTSVVGFSGQRSIRSRFVEEKMSRFKKKGRFLGEKNGFDFR